MAVPLLSEQASLECRQEILAACRLTIEPKALDDFMDLFKSNFESLCDNPVTGYEYWARLGGNMRANGRYIGSFAEYLAKNKDNQLVEWFELIVALEMVRLTCDDRIHMPNVEGEVHLRFQLCGGVAGNPTAREAFKAFLVAIGELPPDSRSVGKYRIVRTR